MLHETLLSKGFNKILGAGLAKRMEEEKFMKMNSVLTLLNHNVEVHMAWQELPKGRTAE